MCPQDENERDDGPKNKKSRSPAYPAFGLETCLKWARMVYDAERRNTTSSAIAAKHMGYSSLSGASRVALSAMKKFGLLMEEGVEKVRVSEDAVRVFLNPNADQVAEDLRSLALRAPLIKEILDEHSGVLPSDETLKFKLVTGRGFSDDGAANFIRALRETVKFVKLGADGYATEMHEPIAKDPAQNVADKLAKPAAESLSQAVGRAFIAATRSAPPRSDEMPSGSSFRFELSDGGTVVIECTTKLTADAVEEIRDHLHLYEKRLRKRSEVGQVGSTGSGSTSE